jgi:undecaprenyl-diphosphatase
LAFWEAIVLGIIQGLTEFLPVSSSGHLALAQYFFGITEPQLFFDIMLHVGTLGAIIVVFRRDIRDVFAAIVGREPASHRMTRKSGRIFAWLIVVGSVPTVIIALLFSMFVEKLFVIPLFVSVMLFTTGVILWLSGRFGPIFQPLPPNSNELAARSTRDLNVISALIIGAAQGIATLPGISRSGATISVALMRGVDREEAARYSLLLSVPAILGAVLLELKDIASIDISVWTIIAGAVVAFVVGYVAIKVLLRTLRRGEFSRFAYYCWGIGAVSILGYAIRRSIGL